MHTLDLLVIGSGAAASTVATRCNKAGWQVGIVDHRPYGGTCALRGCDPKRVLMAAAEVVQASRRLEGDGVFHLPSISWTDLMRFKRGFTEPVPEARQRSYREAGIATFHGRARFVGPTSLTIGDQPVEARKVLVATGAKPIPLPIAGAELLTTSEQFLDHDELPARIVFLGGGYVSFELAHLARVAGAHVTVVEMSERPLARFDPDLVALLSDRTRAMGIDLLLGARAEAVVRRDGGRALLIASTDHPLEADVIVHGAGRVPDVDDLGLDAANVEHDKAGIIVNEHMQSVSNPAVYAAGDAARGGLPLTPVATFEAKVAAANLLEPGSRKAEYPPIPSVVFTLPPLASVGLTEDDAQRRNLRFAVHHAETSGWYSSRRLGGECSGHKVLVDEISDLILGAHVVGPQAEELINVFTLAMRCGMTASALREVIFAYPTRASDLASMV